MSHGPLPIPLLQTDTKIDPTTPVRLLDMSDGHLHTGDAVKYDNGGGASIGGLTSGSTYYLIQVADGKFQLAATHDDAEEGKAITLTSAGNKQQKLIDNENTSHTDATSGGGGGKIGVAGSVAVNVVDNDVEASVGRGGTSAITITGNGDVTISATNTSEAFSRALPAAGGASGKSVGVGASVAINVLSNTALARITDGTTITGSAGKFTMSAASDNFGFTHGENGASSGSVAVGVGVAVLVVHDNTNVYLGTGADIVATGNVSLTAAHTGEYKTTTDASAAGQSVGVGASVSVGVVIDDTSVQVARGVSTSNGALTANSTSTVSSNVQATATSSGEDKTDSQNSTSKNDGSKTGADGQADHAINDNSTTKAPAATATLPIPPAARPARAPARAAARAAAAPAASPFRPPSRSAC